MTFGDDKDIEDKAGYNQAARITEVLAMLRNTYVASMIENDLSTSLKICRRVLDIISAKVKKEEVEKTNKEIKIIHRLLPKANETFLDSGSKFITNVKEREEAEEKIENLWRSLEKLQDIYGYGMFSEDESGL